MKTAHLIHWHNRSCQKLACLTGIVLALAALAACAPGGTAAHTATAAPPPDTPTACVLSTIVAPTRPAETPGYTELDETTGLHITGEAVEIDLAEYRLEVTGNVDQPLSLTYDELRCMDKVEGRPTLVCPGFFEDIATWAGVPLADVLELAGVQDDAGGVRLIGADGYSAIVTMETASSDKSFLAYEWEGEPLPMLHGFPVRAVVPDHNGNVWVKWLIRIDVIG